MGPWENVKQAKVLQEQKGGAGGSKERTVPESRGRLSSLPVRRDGADSQREQACALRRWRSISQDRPGSGLETINPTRVYS